MPTMATPSQVQPLRINKSIPSARSSPNKIPAPRPLAEIGTTERRRNSPSYNQATRKAIVSREASPYTENSFTRETSPRNFWSLKEAMAPSRFDVENTPDRAQSPAPVNSAVVTRRASIEKLKQAGRVKTSNIFALQSKAKYDPSNVPVVERPSAARPLSQSVANNNFARFDTLQKENTPLNSPQAIAAQRRAELRSPKPDTVAMDASSAKRAGSQSPTKSALARNSQFGASVYDPETAAWSDEDDRRVTPRTLRQNKSVTFREEPPVINEYDQPTPEPSLSAASESREGSWDSDEYEEQDYSFERGSSVDQHDDSFDDDLENTDKTPVVLPEQWSRVSPDVARTDLVNEADDVFGTTNSASQRNVSCTESIASDGESRPLPPIPGAQRSRPSRMRASCSKEEILGMTSKSTLTFDQRMELMEQMQKAGNTPAKTTADAAAKPSDAENAGNDTEASFVTGLDELTNSPPMISRESILRKVRSRRFDEEELEVEPIGEASPSRANYADLDPDVPIPSRETSQTTQVPAAEEVTEQAPTDCVTIKLEPADDEEVDLSAIPPADSSDVYASALARQSSVLRHRVFDSSDDTVNESRCSSVEPDAESTGLHEPFDSAPDVDDGKETLQDAMQLLTVKDYSQPEPEPVASHAAVKDFMGLPSYVTSNEYDFGIQKYIEASPPASVGSTDNKPDIMASAPTLPPPASSKASAWKDLPRPTYDGADFSPPDTPESIAQEPEGEVSAIDELDVKAADYPLSPVSPVEPEVSIEIPERRATIRTNGKFKTRPSATPADLRSMAEQRRIVSVEGRRVDSPQELESGETDSLASTGANRTPLDITLEVPALGHDEGLGLDSEFDRVIEAQKKGYHMRENAKVVVATTRNFSNESSGTARSLDSASGTGRAPTRSASRTGAREQVLKTEPWNGKIRRTSQRNASILPNELAPPLPGQASALDVVEEDFAAGTSSLEDDVGDDVERGRLFVKVLGIKNLDLPLPRGERTHFQLTLDNGLHCVTTSDLDMGRNAIIGQEFELVVLNDLEFQLTLTTKLTPPAREADSSAASAAKKSSLKAGTFSRFLTSPKKRAERERQEREAQEAEERKRKEELMRKRATMQPTAWDLLHELVNGADGSFARAYVNLKAHERDCFGRALTVEVPCYNEWAMEKDTTVINSVRNKRGLHNGPVRRPPYVVGHLEVQLLYIPRPKNAAEEDMPKSLSAAVREIARADKEANENIEVTHEGHLSQQGGDCQHWRRRFFRLQGSKLTAYHEHTHQKRAVINLTKASRLVDDKSTLVADPAAASGSRAKRRKSAFAEEDEGYAYVEEGFRIRFANGETIDFYADKTADKVEWMKKLAKVIGRPAVAVEKRALKWTDLVHARERANGQSAGVDAKSGHVHSAGPPPTPAKDTVGSRRAPATEHRATTPPLERRAQRTRDAVKSMIF